MIYETKEEAKLRLGGTVILHGRTVLLVRDIEEDRGADGVIQDILLETLLLPNLRVQKWYKMSDPKLNIKHISLGYFNLSTNEYCFALYLRRVPIRRYKQGLCRENVFIPESPKLMQIGLVPHVRQGRGARGAIYADDDELRLPPPVRGGNVIPFESIIKEDSFRDMLNGDYPSYQQARENFLDLHKNLMLKAIAFTPILSVEQDDDIGLMYIQYKGGKVAYSTDDGRTFRLAPKFTHLAELFEENNLKLA